MDGNHRQPKRVCMDFEKRVWMGTTDNQCISNHKIFLPMVRYLSLWFGWYRVGIGIGMV
jgi:hypothetical protein